MERKKECYLVKKKKEYHVSTFWGKNSMNIRGEWLFDRVKYFDGIEKVVEKDEPSSCLSDNFQAKSRFVRVNEKAQLLPLRK